MGLTKKSKSSIYFLVLHLHLLIKVMALFLMNAHFMQIKIVSHDIAFSKYLYISRDYQYAEILL